MAALWLHYGCTVNGGFMAAVLLWAVAVALSRIVLGVHFPGDTLAGGLMGTSFALIASTTLLV